MRVWGCPELICGVNKINIFLQVGFSLDVPEAGPVLPGTASSGLDMGLCFSWFKTHGDIPV